MSIRLAILMVLIGSFAPIYGFEILGLKWSLFRLGIFAILLPYFIVKRIKMKVIINKRILKIFILFISFIVIRLITLIWSPEQSSGLKQIVWFSENITFCVMLIILSNSYANLHEYYFRRLIIIGFLSVGMIFLQFALLYTQRVSFMLPFSTFPGFGIPIEQLRYMPRYPIYPGGRIIGAFYEPNEAGTVVSYFVAILIPMLIIKHPKYGMNRLILAVMLGVSIIASIATGSRQSLLVIAVVALINILFVIPRSKYYMLLAVVVLLFFSTAIISPLIQLFNTDVKSVSGEIQMNSVKRIISSFDTGKPFGGRNFQMFDRLEKNITPTSLIIGHGEGSSRGRSHYGYHVILFENGIFGLMVIVVISILLVKESMVYLKSRNKEMVLKSTISLSIAISWIVFISINWAQLNGLVTAPFLALTIIIIQDQDKNKEIFRNAK